MTSQNTSENVVQFPEQPELNDAFYHGKDTPEWRELLQQDFTFMCGNSSKQSKWSPTTFTLDDWIKGRPKGNNAVRAFGFSRHPEANRKDGPCIVLGASVGGGRTAETMSTVCALGLDVDAGAGLDWVLDKLDDLGIACLVGTTFNHNTTTLSLKHSNVLRKMGLDGNPPEEEIHTYLRDHDPHGYSDEFISQVKIANPRHQTADGVMIELETPEIEKFRLIFPLNAPVSMLDLGPTQDVIKKMFADKICGLAVDLVGVPFDASCTDPSRIFFTGRHPIGRDDWYCAIVRGRGLDWDEIPVRDKIAYVKSRQSKGSENSRDLRTPSGKSLKVWWHDAKEHFMLADLIENECPDKIRGNPKPGFIEVECPREDFHTKAGGTGCFTINCLDSESETFIWKCQHDACQGYGTLDFIHDALEQGWFDEGHLCSDEYLLPPADDVTTQSTEETAKSVEDKFDQDSSDAEICEYLTKLMNDGADKSTINRTVGKLAETTALGKSDLNRMVKEIRANARESARDDGNVPATNRDNFKDMVQFGEDAIVSANDKAEIPIVFTYEDDIAAIHNGQRDMVNKDQFEALVNDYTTWQHVTVSGDAVLCREVSAPLDVTKYMFNRGGKPYPHLIGVKTTPYFSADGNLIDQEGYDPDTQMVLQLNGLKIPRVSAVPDDDEVHEAKRLLIEEAFSDFPFDGVKDRDDCIVRGLDTDGAPLPSLAHAITLTLQPFAREMINGVTPVFTLTKPAAGTGGGRLIEVSSLIATGDEAPAQPMPTNEDELSKTITACVNYASEYCFFDNTNLAADSGAFASAITAPKYRARLLGSSRMVEAVIRHTWVMVANNIKGTTEILRRLVMIELDAKTANPENRSGWHHTDLKDWVRKSRGKLVWACLTLIQNFVAKGMKPWDGELKGSFEEWSRIMGGILRDAGIRGFLGNESHLRTYAAIGGDSGVQQFIDHLAGEYDSGVAFRPGGTSEIRGHSGAVVSLQDELNLADDGKPLAIDGWGYHSTDFTYNHARKIASMFRDAARKTWRCGDWEVSFEELPDPKSPSAYYWAITKTNNSDKKEASGA